MAIVRFSSEQVYRSALVLEPRQAFVDWHDRLGLGSPPYADVSREEGETVFLIPDVEDPDESRRFVDEHFDTFFSHVLDMHCPDQRLWPRPRTAALFREWFRPRVHSLVLDVDPSPLEHG